MTKSLAPKGYGETYRNWVLRLRQDCLRRQKSARRTKGSGSSFSAWPTATTRDWKDTGNLENVPENGLLGRVDANWRTPRAKEDGEYQYSRGDHSKPTPTLTGQTSDFSHLDLSTSTHGEPSSKERRSLNPRFVAWLMGWPQPASTGFGFSETESSRFRPLMRSALLQLDLPGADQPAQLALFG
jgi:hypothetical protein